VHRVLIVIAAVLCAAGPAAASTSQDWWPQDVGADLVAPPGPGVPIAIVDTGVDPSHPAFSGRLNTSFLNNQTVTGSEEFHGTAVASVAISVYPQATLESWDASPAGFILDLDAVTGITTIADRCPAVINISFGGTTPDPPLQDAILYAVHKGCLVVAAAGNSGQRGNPVTYPAAYPHVLTVGAIEENDQLAPFSTAGAGLDLCAPGVDIVGAVPLSRDPTGYNSGLAGTSFSAPIVTAAAAWVWSARPTLDPGQVAGLLRSTARDIGTPGYDQQCGFGIVSIPAALTAPAPPVDPQEPNDDVDQVKPGARFDDGRPTITTAAKPSLRIAGTIDAGEDPRDVYRIWVPAHRVVRASVSANGAAAARIWGSLTTSVQEGIDLRRRDLKGPLIRGGAKGLTAYVEVLLTGASSNASYVLSVTAAKR
jgi:subtilisin family serine protease